MATDAYARALVDAPTIAGDPYWTSAERAVPFDSILATALQHGSPVNAALIRAFAGKGRPLT